MGKRQSRPWIVSDELWSLIEPLLPEPPPKQVEGRPRVPDRQALCGILFVLHTGIQWEYLPQELGFGSGMTCWRRLAAWNEAGVWDQLHQLLLNKLRSKNQLDWSRAVMSEYGPFSPAKYARTGPTAWSPQGRGWPIASQPRDRADCPGWGNAPSRSDARRAPLTGRPVTHPQRSGGPGSPACT